MCTAPDKAVDISVVVPTYNRAAMLKRALSSVLAQTYRAFELIVVDDGSQDHTPVAIESIADPRLMYIRHDRNKGASAARNTGVRASHGEFIAFLDSDDEWLPTKLERQLEVFGRSSDRPGLVYTGIEYYYPDRPSRRGPPRYRGRILRNVLADNVVGSTSVAMVRRDVFDLTGGFDENLKALQDADLWVRIAQCVSVDFVPEILVRVHMHSGADRISYDQQRRLAAREAFYQKHHDLFTSFGGADQFHAKTARIYLRQCGDRRASRYHSWRAIQAKPLSLLAYVTYAASFVPKFLFTGRLAASGAAHRFIHAAKRMPARLLGRV